MNILKTRKVFVSITLAIIVLIISIIYYIRNDYESIDNKEISLLENTTSEKKENKSDKKFIDIKGSVNNPGVYEFKENDRVIDAINMAGGLKSDANTSNINLSKKLTSEMVIYVYNNSEIKNNTENLSCDNVCKTEIIEVNNCVELTTKKNNQSSNETININTASLDELMTLSGIGESKAKSIIEYRKENRFKSIEDLKNISGIGESLFDKIKDNITV